MSLYCTHWDAPGQLKQERLRISCFGRHYGKSPWVKKAYLTTHQRKPWFGVARQAEVPPHWRRKLKNSRLQRETMNKEKSQWKWWQIGRGCELQSKVAEKFTAVRTLDISYTLFTTTPITLECLGISLQSTYVNHVYHTPWDSGTCKGSFLISPDFCFLCYL